MPDQRRIYDDHLYCHFVTFSCHRRRRLLDEDHPKQIVLGQLNAQLERQSAKCVGFVVMPDHVHAVIWFPKPRQLSRFMQSWKRLSSYTIRKWYEREQAAYLQKIENLKHIWTPKYYSFEIETRRKLEEKLDYMHMNPVRAGLVEKAIDWLYSSARWYHDQTSVGVPIHWVE
jgi:putative transposase